MLDWGTRSRVRNPATRRLFQNHAKRFYILNEGGVILEKEAAPYLTIFYLSLKMLILSINLYITNWFLEDKPLYIHKYALLIMLSLTLMVSAGCNQNQTAAIENTFIVQPIETQLDSIIQTYTDEGQFSGSVLVAKNGEIILSKGYGMSDYENNLKNTPQTQYLIASMTKQFTAFAIIRLRDANLLDLEDPIKKYLPELKNWGDITIRQLLKHTSGLPRTTPVRYDGYGQYYIQEGDLLFASGEDFSYSNTGYFLLGCIVEKVSGESLGAYLQENIFTPLKMTHTGSMNHNACTCLAKGLINHKILQDNTLFSVTSLSELPNHCKDHNGLVELEPTDTRDNLGAGDIYSTVEDLFIWCQALTNGELLSESIMNEIFTPGEGNYGYGWYIWPNGEWKNIGHRLIEHSGLIEGFTSRVCIFSDSNVVIIVLSNIENAPEEQLNYALAQQLFDSTDLAESKGQILETADKVWADYFQAAGGEIALNSQKEQVRKGSWETSSGLKIPITVMCKAPDKYILSYDISSPVKVYFNGSDYWVKSPAGTEKEISGQFEEWRNIFKLSDPLYLPENFSDMDIVGKATLGKRECYVMEDKSKVNRVFISVDSKMPLRVDNLIKSPLVQFIRTYYDDYRMIDGVMLPFIIRKAGWEINFYQIKNTDQLEDSLFEPN